MEDSISPQEDTGTAILVVKSGIGDDRTDLIQELIAAADQQPNILAVTLTDSLETWVDQWRGHLPRPPAQLGAVTLNEHTRSAAVDSSGRSRPDPPISTHTVSSPADLTGLSIAITTYLEDWATTDRRTIVYFDSLTVLFQYVELQPVFKFLHTLLARMQDNNATGIFPFNTAAHDDQTVATLQTLFDTILIPNSEGTHLIHITDE